MILDDAKSPDSNSKKTYAKHSHTQYDTSIVLTRQTMIHTPQVPFRGLSALRWLDLDPLLLRRHISRILG